MVISRRSKKEKKKRRERVGTFLQLPSTTPCETSDLAITPLPPPSSFSLTAHPIFGHIEMHLNLQYKTAFYFPF